MLYPGIDFNKTISIFDEFGNNYQKIDDYQILDFSICGYMPAALLVPFLNYILETTAIPKNILTTI